MNREDIIRMAREAKLSNEIGAFGYPYLPELERFAALVAAHALVEPCCGNYDQCQKVCMPRAASAERDRIFGDLLKMHEMAKSQHNYFLHAVLTLKARGQA